MDITMHPGETPAMIPPFDPHARARIEEVAASLLDLNARLEVTLQSALERLDALEDALSQLGMVQVPQ